MHAHIVLAHPEPQSFNAHLARVAARTLEASGWTATISDLYAQGFDPCERASHYAERVAPARFDVQSEQRHASETRNVPVDVAAEIAALERADLLILQFPFWWHMPPAMLKGWFDRVFIYGAVYASKQRFEHGRFRGKRAMLSVTVGTSPETYHHNGRSGDIDLLLWPTNFSLAYVGFDVLTHHVAYGVEAGLRYSDAATVKARLEKIEHDWVRDLRSLSERPAIPFNRMAEWKADGHITPDAPAYSPFIRHRKDLQLK
jgi:NAD(P)H dehydrogenase (quinone)